MYSKLASSDQILNKNCFNYLKALKVPPRLLEELPKHLAKIAELQSPKAEYDANFAYGNLYKKFIDYINHETTIDKLLQTLESIKKRISSEYFATVQQLAIQAGVSVEDKQLQNRLLRTLSNKKEQLAKEREQIEPQFNDFFISVYQNDNNNLEETYTLIQDILLRQTPIAPAIKTTIAQRTRDPKELINTEILTPSQAETVAARMNSVFSNTYYTLGTNIPTLRKYKWNQNSSVKELRFGTQGQRHLGKEHVSPAFEQFLLSQANKAKTKKITHLYFNNLGRDEIGYERNRERALTQALESLEDRHSNVAVITLPAEKGLMTRDHYLHSEPTLEYEKVKDEFLHIASQDPTCTLAVKDFYISDKIRRRLFTKNGEYSLDIEKRKITDLIDNSFKLFTIEPSKILSYAEKQAVWFHFIKFELTNYIIETFTAANPELTINFSCKDAIDRGGVSSAYYNLLKSFASSSPMTREEFERGLHAAPTMVKGRGMNDHLNILWNCIDLYVNQKYETLKDNSQQAWLIVWRDMNCPKGRVHDLLQLRLPQLKKELEDSGIKHKKAGIEILDHIENQLNQGVSGKRLLLEAAVRTPSVILKPNDIVNLYKFGQLADDLAINFPKLNILAGLMKCLVGLITYAFSKDTLNEGWATIKAGLAVDKRRELQQKMKEQLTTGSLH